MAHFIPSFVKACFKFAGFISYFRSALTSYFSSALTSYFKSATITTSVSWMINSWFTLSYNRPLKKSGLINPADGLRGWADSGARRNSGMDWLWVPQRIAGLSILVQNNFAQNLIFCKSWNRSVSDFWFVLHVGYKNAKVGPKRVQNLMISGDSWPRSQVRIAAINFCGRSTFLLLMGDPHFCYL